MKALALIALFFVIGCGKVETSKSFTLVRKFEPLVVDTSHKNMLASLCNQLAQKQVIIDQTLGRPFVFSLAQKSCTEERTGAFADVTVTTARENQDYVFKQGSGYFAFQFIETSTSGVMKEVCANLSNLTSPFRAANGTAVWLSMDTLREDCPIASGQTCVLFEVGSADFTNPENYNIFSREWIRFISNPNEQLVGFYSYRKRQSKALCTGDRMQIYETFLK